MDESHVLLIVIVSGGVTLLLRTLPFLTFGHKTPDYILYLGRVLPYAIMGMLVVYCLRDISFLKAPYGIPEAISCVLVVLLHVWRRSTLISIIGGTVCYMMLVQGVF